MTKRLKYGVLIDDDDLAPADKVVTLGDPSIAHNSTPDMRSHAVTQARNTKSNADMFSAAKQKLDRRAPKAKSKHPVGKPGRRGLRALASAQAAETAHKVGGHKTPTRSNNPIVSDD